MSAASHNEAAPLLSDAQLDALVAAFPALRDLHLLGMLQQDGVSFTALTRLNALTSLRISGVDVARARELAQLTQLVQLSTHSPTRMNDDALLHFTALRRLTLLSAPDRDSVDGNANSFQNTVSACGCEQ